MVNSVKKNPFNTFSENRVFQIALPPPPPPTGVEGGFLLGGIFFYWGQIAQGILSIF